MLIEGYVLKGCLNDDHWTKDGNPLMNGESVFK